MFSYSHFKIYEGECSCGENYVGETTTQYFPLVLFIVRYKVVLTLESVDEILKCGHSNESY